MAKYSDIKGFTVQTLSSDTATSAVAGGTWASGGAGNTGREGPGSNGTQTSNLAYGGSPPATNKTESYNGTAFTEVADLNTTRYSLGGAGVSNTSAVGFGGYAPGGASAVTETWDGSSWTEVNDLNTGRYGIAGAGIITSAIGIAGYTTTIVNNVETWNGSSWTETTDINTTRYVVGATGHDNEAVIIFGGAAPSKVDNVEVWNGSSWTEVSEINSARNAPSGSGTDSLALAYGGRTPSPGATTKTESWDGTSWTEINDLSTGRANGGGSNNGTSSAALFSFGNREPGLSPAATEEFTAPAVFSKITEGQLYFNSTTNTFKETISDVPGTSWSSGTNLNSTRAFNNAAGSIPSAITFGGSPAPTQAYAEQWNGSAWTEVADLNEGRVGGAGGGASGTDAIMAGGYELPNVGNSVNTEIWDGSSWTEVNNLNAQKYTAGSAIPVSTSGFAFGGNPSVATAEVWDGTNWTEVSDLNTARMYLAGFGSATSAIAGNGIDPSASPPTYLQNKVEKWDGSSWTEVAEYNTARVENLQGQGSSNAAGIVAGGGTTGSNQIANTEIWNGTSWTELNDLATARRMGGNIGSTSNGMYVGGNSGPGSSTTVEHWESGLANKTITAS